MLVERESVEIEWGKEQEEGEVGPFGRNLMWHGRAPWHSATVPLCWSKVRRMNMARSCLWTRGDRTNLLVTKAHFFSSSVFVARPCHLAWGAHANFRPFKSSPSRAVTVFFRSWFFLNFFLSSPPFFFFLSFFLFFFPKVITLGLPPKKCLFKSLA